MHFISYAKSSLQEHFNQATVKTLKSTLWCRTAEFLERRHCGLNGSHFSRPHSLMGGEAEESGMIWEVSTRCRQMVRHTSLSVSGGRFIVSDATLAGREHNPLVLSTATPGGFRTIFQQLPIWLWLVRVVFLLKTSIFAALAVAQTLMAIISQRVCRGEPNISA